MRHLVFGRKLGRDTNGRKALFRILASSILARGAITTTLAKAKFVQGPLEKLITGARGKNLAAERGLASLLSVEAFEKLTGEVVSGVDKRLGGYTRIVKLARRLGDAAPMARIELVDWPKNQSTMKEQKTKVLKADSQSFSKQSVKNN